MKRNSIDLREREEVENVFSHSPMPRCAPLIFFRSATVAPTMLFQSHSGVIGTRPGNASGQAWAYTSMLHGRAAEEKSGPSF